MHGIPRRVDDLSAAVARVSRSTIISLTIIMTIVLFAQVVMRYAFNVALSWSEEVSMAIFTWVVMIGGSLGVREGFHVRISLLPDALPGAVRSALERLFDLGTFAFGISLLLAGHVYVRETVGQVSAAVGYPLETLHVAAPVCGGLVALHALARCLSRQPNLEANQTAEPHIGARID